MATENPDFRLFIDTTYDELRNLTDKFFRGISKKECQRLLQIAKEKLHILEKMTKLAQPPNDVQSEMVLVKAILEDAYNNALLLLNNIGNKEIIKWSDLLASK